MEQKQPYMGIPSGKLTKVKNMAQADLPIKIVMFQSYVSLPEGIAISRQAYNLPIMWN